MLLWEIEPDKVNKYGGITCPDEIEEVPIPTGMQSFHGIMYTEIFQIDEFIFRMSATRQRIWKFDGQATKVFRYIFCEIFDGD